MLSTKDENTNDVGWFVSTMKGSLGEIFSVVSKYGRQCTHTHIINDTSFSEPPQGGLGGDP